MAIEPTGTCVVWPPLTDGQVDSLVQRFEDAWADGKINLTSNQAGAVLGALFTEQYAGDEEAILLEAAKVRDRVEERRNRPEGADVVRPMPNGHRPTYQPPPEKKRGA